MTDLWILTISNPDQTQGVWAFFLDEYLCRVTAELLRRSAVLDAGRVLACLHQLAPGIPL